MLTMDIATQMYIILKQPDVRFLTQVVFNVLIQNVRYICKLVSLQLPSLNSMLFSVLNNCQIL
jgi:hypothetical protein